MKVLIIGFVWPEPNSSAAGSRMMQLIDVFSKQKWDVTFGCAAVESEYMANLTELGINCHKIVLNDSSFDAFVSDLIPEIVLFDRFMTEEQFGWRVAENCPNALRVLDTEDLHFLRKARHQSLKEGRELLTTDLFSDMAKREIASIMRSDLTLMISEIEMTLLQDLFKVDATLLYYLPFLLESVSIRQIDEWRPFALREDFVFIGNFHHEPNRDAVLYLKKEIWPLLRKLLPNAKMNIYGAYLPPAINQLHDPKVNFYIQGRAENSNEVIGHAKIMLAPLRFGAGIKGKLTEAMLCGTPSITTSIGAEAMHGKLPWNGAIADDAASFAKAAALLFEHETLFEKAQRNGVEIIATRYDRNLFEQEFVKYLEALLNDISVHRSQNFIGQMLMHQTMSATKYMSRWIEEKNKTEK